MTVLHVIARGKIGRSAEAELVDRYSKRINWPFKLTELSEKAPLPAPPRHSSKVLLLDEKGQNLSSSALADIISKWRDEGTGEIRFVIGAADGHSDTERAQADALIAFGAATWPHLLVRAMVVEQIYRATAIIAGHPYHREG